MRELLRLASVVPHWADGDIDGFKLFAIRRSGSLRALGLENNDVVLSLNGFPLAPSEGATPWREWLSELTAAEEFTVGVRRRGETLEVAIARDDLRQVVEEAKRRAVARTYRRKDAE